MVLPHPVVVENLGTFSLYGFYVSSLQTSFESQQWLLLRFSGYYKGSGLSLTKKRSCNTSFFFSVNIFLFTRAMSQYPQILRFLFPQPKMVVQCCFFLVKLFIFHFVQWIGPSSHGQVSELLLFFLPNYLVISVTIGARLSFWLLLPNPIEVVTCSKFDPLAKINCARSFHKFLCFLKRDIRINCKNPFH